MTNRIAKWFALGIVAVGFAAGVLLTTGQAEAQVVQQPIWRLLGGNVSTILGSWKVGVGTTTPWGKLSITGTAGQTNPLFQIASSTQTPVFTVAADGTATFAGDVTISGTCTGCGAGVAGSDTQVIFNDGGSAYGGDAGLTFNKTNDSLAVVGTTTASTTVTGYGQTSIFETGVTYYAKGAIRSDDPNVGAALIFERNASSCPLGGCGIWAYRSRGDRTTKTVVQSGDSIGTLYYGGYDGTDYEPAASIAFTVGGTPGDNDMPGKIVFNTTADGANTLTERFSIDAAGVLTIPTTGKLAAPYASSTALTVSGTHYLGSGGVIDFDSGDITFTQSANTLTLGGGNLALGANSLTMTGSIAATGARVTKGWFTDIESTNMPTVGGTSLSSTFALLASPTFTGTLTFANATGTNATSSLSHYFPFLATAAGTFVAIDPAGKMIATSSPSSGATAFETVEATCATGATGGDACSTGVISCTGAKKIVDVGWTLNSFRHTVNSIDYGASYNTATIGFICNESAGGCGTGNNTGRIVCATY